MAQRYTVKDAKVCLGRLARAVGKRVATAYNDVGGLLLDCNSSYGGCMVEEVSSSGGGVNTPFGSRRMKPANFCEAVSFAEDVMRVAGGRRFDGAGRRKRRR